MELEVIRLSASEIAPKRPQTVNNSSTTKRKLKPRPAPTVIDNDTTTNNLESTTISVPPVLSALTDLPSVVAPSSILVFPQEVVAYTGRFKPEKKRPKRKPIWTLEQKFVNAGTKKAYTHWRDKAKELPKTKAKTSVLSLMYKSAPKEPPPRRQNKPNNDKGPRVPVQPTLKPAPAVEGGVKTGSSASLTALHSPVRGHDPSAIGWHLSRISYSLVVFVFAVLAHDRFTELV
jgi:hypothetical protein